MKEPTMLRIWIQRGKIKRKYVLVAQPFPKVGDEITLAGESGWFVSRIQDASDVIEVKFPAKATVVYEKPTP